MMLPAEDPNAEEPKPTALYAACAGASVANSWTAVNGYAVARAYTSTAEEYEAARASAVLADLGAVARYTARGKGAADFLARATSAPVLGLEIGESARGLMLNEAGVVVDVVEAARLGSDLYMLACTRPHSRRLQLAARGVDARVEAIGAEIAALAIFGPSAREVARAAGLDVPAGEHAVQSRVRGIETSVRPIHYGALAGLEVIFPYEEALALWERIRRARGPGPIGLDALEIARIEGGAPRPGVDFTPADRVVRSEDGRFPAEIGLDHLAPTDRAWFGGRRALKAAGPARRVLATLAIDADAAPPGAIVQGRRGQVGRLTSAAYSPWLRSVVAFADLRADALAGPLEIELGADEAARAPARLFETPESRLAAAFRAAAKPRG